MRRTMLEIVKSTVQGAPVDQLAAIEARLHAEKANAAAAARELEQLEQQRRVSDDYETASSLDGAIGRARWTIERSEALIPLEGERDAALAERRREQLARHTLVIAKLHPRLRRAIEAAAAVQVEAISARQAAIADLGEGLVTANIPTITFGGLLLPDLVGLWAAELDRAFAGPQPRPAPAKAAPAPPRPKPIDTGRGRPVGPDPPPPAPRVRRPLRRDSEAGEGERLIIFLRSGVEVSGFQAIAGDVLAVPITTADGLVKSGAAEFARAPIAQDGSMAERVSGGQPEQSTKTGNSK